MEWSVGRNLIGTLGIIGCLSPTSNDMGWMIGELLKWFTSSP